jgi:hypothetical protein
VVHWCKRPSQSFALSEPTQYRPILAERTDLHAARAGSPRICTVAACSSAG